MLLKRKCIGKRTIKHAFYGILSFLAITMCLVDSLANVNGINYGKLSSSQIVNEGGENSSVWDSDGITVSKTIDGTDAEDVFDITLQVKTKQSVEQVLRSENTAVVLLMDLSNSMLRGIDGSAVELGSGRTKAELSISAAQNFISDFYDKSLSYIDDSVGVVGFNTDGVEIEPMTLLDSDATVEAINNDMSDKIKTLLGSYDQSSDPRRYTNIEAGLKMAKTMLDNSANKYKYIILLSDGLPTTYTVTQGDTDYIGVDPTTMTDGMASSLFESSGAVYYTTSDGTNYSDTGAIRARNVASAIKDSGVTIFSVGIGLSSFVGKKCNYSAQPYDYDGQSFLNGQKYLMNIISRTVIARIATVENDFSYTWNKGKYNTSHITERYRIWQLNRSNIYNLHWEIARAYDETTGTYSYLPLNSSTQLFENWLKYSIGSGYYYDAMVDSGVQDAVNGVIGRINEDLSMRRPEVWTTVDPMSAFDKEDSSSLLNYIEFQGFFNKNNELVGSLTGKHRLDDENTASFVTDDVVGSGEIRWDLKDSGLTITSIQGETVYVYTLKYRIRLKVEASGFVSKKDYDTNGQTTLVYILKNNQGEFTDAKAVNYPIPVVEGYLANLKIAKTIDGFKDGENPVGVDTNFEFSLSLKDSQNQSITNTFFYDKYDFNDNLLAKDQSIIDGGTFTLKANEYIIVRNLYHGIHYGVSEATQNGFLSSVTSGSQDGVIVSTVPFSEIVFTNKPYRLEILKVDEINEKPLQNAIFSLYANYHNKEYDSIVTNLNGVELSRLTTSEDGRVDLGNLDFTKDVSTTYYLKEEFTPNMYVSIEDPVEISINAQGVTAKLSGTDLRITKNDEVYTIYVPNKRGDNYVEPEDIVPNTSTQDNFIVHLIVVFGIGLSVVGAGIKLFEKHKF